MRLILLDPFIWRLAWRDARHSITRLSALVASLIVGVAAMVVISSFNYSFTGDIDDKAKALLGADFVMTSYQPFSEEVLQKMDSLHWKEAIGAETASMALFANGSASRLVRIVALQGMYPFYGSIETLPQTAVNAFRYCERCVLVDEALFNQYKITVGDSIKIGSIYFNVLGAVHKISALNAAMSSYFPNIYIPLRALEATTLIRYGSNVAYKRFYKVAETEDLQKTIENMKPLLTKYDVQYTTVEKHKEGLGLAFRLIYSFFASLALIALLLGCIGVANSIHVYAKAKKNQVAILRSVGASGWQSFSLYFIQIFVLSLIGGLLGTALGVSIHQFLPLMLKEYFDFNMNFGIAWKAVLEGIVLSVVISVVFVAIPLVPIRYVPPLLVLRTANASVRRFPVWVQVGIVTLAAMLLFFASWYQTHSVLYGIFFLLALAFTFVVLWGTSSVVLWLAKRLVTDRTPFIFRYAFRNLFRPDNQSASMIVTIGMGVLLIFILHILQQSVLSKLELGDDDSSYNIIVVDIQSYQKEGVEHIVKEQHDVEIKQMLPMVTCRLLQINDRRVADIRNDSLNDIPTWALTREYRVTYRDSLRDAETLYEGALQRLQQREEGNGITISYNLSNSLNTQVGDSLVFDVQGVPLPVKIVGIRKVDWANNPPNFSFVFPRGLLDGAPQVWVMTMYAPPHFILDVLQTSLITAYPNISVIDLKMMLSILNTLADRLSLVIRFLGLFSIITGLIVLIAVVLSSKNARAKNNALLRAIGGQSQQIILITVIEYVCLGFFAAFVGTILSLLLGWLLVTYFFEIPFSCDFLLLGSMAFCIVASVALIGWVGSRSVVRASPLQTL